VYLIILYQTFPLLERREIYNLQHLFAALIVHHFSLIFINPHPFLLLWSCIFNKILWFSHIVIDLVIVSLQFSAFYVRSWFKTLYHHASTPSFNSNQHHQPDIDSIFNAHPSMCPKSVSNFPFHLSWMIWIRSHGVVQCKVCWELRTRFHSPMDLLISIINLIWIEVRRNNAIILFIHSL